MTQYRVEVHDNYGNIFTIIEQPREYLNRQFMMLSLEAATMDLIKTDADVLFINFLQNRHTVAYGTVIHMPNDKLLWCVIRTGDTAPAYLRVFKQEGLA